MKNLYDSIEPGYYHDALIKGWKVQRFWHKQRFNKMSGLIDSVRDKKILDTGCASGTYLATLPNSYKLAIGLDIAFDQVKFGKENFSNLRNLSWIASRTPKLPFKENSFDYIIMGEVIEHVDQTDILVKDILRILKPGGKLILTTPNYRSAWPIIEFFWVKLKPLDYYQQHISKFYIKNLSKALQNAGFREINLSTFYLLSPFASIFSHRIGERIMKIEEKILPKLGALILASAKK